jgi:hypothetical protein
LEREETHLFGKDVAKRLKGGADRALDQLGWAVEEGNSADKATQVPGSFA